MATQKRRAVAIDADQVMDSLLMNDFVEFDPPIPLTQLVPLLVDLWEEEGLVEGGPEPLPLHYASQRKAY